MKNRIKPAFADSVAETLFIPLWMRVQETHHAHPIIHDEAACMLAERIDYDFAQFTHDKMSQLGVAVRTRYLDGVMQRFIDTHENPVVVLLGCGLDTRYQRLQRQGNTMCYELDLPEVIDFRRQLLPETEHDVYIASSMFDTGWMDALRARHPNQPFLFICEGVVMYFDIGQVRQFVQDLARHFPGSTFYVERSGTMIVNKARMHASVKHTQAQFKSGMDDPHEVESWVPGSRLVDTFYYMGEERRRGGLMGLLMRLVPVLRRSFGIWGYQLG